MTKTASWDIVGCEYEELKVNPVFSFFCSSERSSTKKYLRTSLVAAESSTCTPTKRESLCIVVIASVVLDLVVYIVSRRSAGEPRDGFFYVQVKYKEPKLPFIPSC